MFDLFSWSHLLIIGVVALVVVGPKDLPRLMRIGGQWIAKARGMAHEFRQSFDDMARASELDELRKEIETLRSGQQSAPNKPNVDHGILPEDDQSAALDRGIYAHEHGSDHVSAGDSIISDTPQKTDLPTQ